MFRSPGNVGRRVKGDVGAGGTRAGPKDVSAAIIPAGTSRIDRLIGYEDFSDTVLQARSRETFVMRGFGVPPPNGGGIALTRMR